MILRRLWRDEAGFVLSTELTLVASVLVLGLTAGLVSVRDQMVQELSDTAMAISSLNQTFSFSAVTGCNASTAGTSFLDENDFCDEEQPSGVGFPPACSAVQKAAEEDEELQGI